MRPLGCFLWKRVILFKIDAGNGSPPGPTYFGMSDFWFFRSLGLFLEIMFTVVPGSSKFSLAAGSQFTLPLCRIFGVTGGLSVSLLKASDNTLMLTSVSKHSQHKWSLLYYTICITNWLCCFCICTKHLWAISIICSWGTIKETTNRKYVHSF